MKNNKIIYTCITGNYDSPPQCLYKDDWDYVFFTDNKKLIKKGAWGRFKVMPLAFNKLDKVRNAKWHKTHAHILFPNYKYSVWIDGNIYIQTEKAYKILKNLVAENELISVRLHPERDCIYEEAEFVKKCKVDYPEIIDKEMMTLKEQKYPINNGLHETNIIFRQHNDMKLIKSMEEWWYFIENHSRRDQLSFDYVIWKHKINLQNFKVKRENLLNSKDFKKVLPPSHSQHLITGSKLSLFKFLVSRLFSIRKEIKGNYKRKNLYILGFKIRLKKEKLAKKSVD